MHWRREACNRAWCPPERYSKLRFVGSYTTPYWRGAGAKTFHIGYAFIPDTWFPRLEIVTVAFRQDWIDSGLSSHVPFGEMDIADA